MKSLINRKNVLFLFIVFMELMKCYKEKNSCKGPVGKVAFIVCSALCGYLVVPFGYEFNKILFIIYVRNC